MKKILKLLIVILFLFVLSVVAYIFYMQMQYYRIEDNLKLEITKNSKQKLAINQEYKMITFNIGYGAYSHDFSFFLDSAILAENNQKITGKYGKGISYDDVLKNTKQSIDILKNNDADFYLLQEVDVKAHRSYNINQVASIKDVFDDYASVYASNFHSAFLAMPIYDMHGAVESGLLSLSKFQIDEAIRKSYPVSDNFFTKFTDLDRCFKVLRYKLNNDKELVVINNHMTAYDKGGVIRKKQLELLNQFLALEKEKDNYVIVGGDFNHDYCDSKDLHLGNKKIPDWISKISDDELVSGYHFVIPLNRELIGSCRGAEEPYNKQTSYQVIIDGFIVSDNIDAQAEIIDTDYISSDHQPVLLKFKLK